ncbi:MAG: glycosyltransferase [Proteobacteria bacterium]|nr:glycosyltransferase [Pseudomonadota bacterium]
MWKIAYNILLHILLPFFLLFSLTKRKIRNNLAERLWSSTNNTDLKGAIWIHAASIGEAVIAEAIVNYMRNRSGFDNFLITTNTYYARDMLRKKFNNRISVYSLPFDLTYSLKHFISTSTFKSLLIVETEIWPNLVWQAKKRNIPVIIINGRISDKTYKTYLFFYLFIKNVFSDITLVLAQSEEHAKRFNALGMDSIKVINTGNIKYYRDLATTSDNIHKENIITFGSIKEKEVDIILQVIDMLKKRFSQFKFFIVPRELNLVDVIENGLASRLNTMRYSVYKKSSIEAIQAVETIVVDTVGDLPDVYKKSMVAFVGGSLAPYGGQNILEPLFFGTPVLFGPYMENFRDIAGTILESGAGIMVNNTEELSEKISLLIENDRLREKMGEQGRRIIEAQKEVMERAVNIILETIAEK